MTTSMKFADIVLDAGACATMYPAMTCRSTRLVERDRRDNDGGSAVWRLVAGGDFDFTTYFNALSVVKLRGLTSATGAVLHLQVKGGAFDIEQMCGKKLSLHAEAVPGTLMHVDASEDWHEVTMPIRFDDDMVITAFCIHAGSAGADDPSGQRDVLLRNAYYDLELTEAPRDIELAVATTTFKKERFITANIDLINREIFGSGEPIAEHMHYYVVDNGRTLDAQALDTDRVTIIPNQNVGGAGGFTRGMIAALDQEPPATHVLVMDDDISVSPESIKRTFNLLRILTPEHYDAMISGAMLNYESGEEQWEDTGFVSEAGFCNAVKPPLHLEKFEDVVYGEIFRLQDFMEKNHYAAWWYCCIPTDVIRRQGLPLPLFIRHDDAEYGSREPREFITMNSLCVWHLPFYERYNPAVERYQATRNPMIAQATTGVFADVDFVKQIQDIVQLELRKFGYENASLVLDGFEDFLKGPKFFMKKGQAEKSFMAANKAQEKIYGFDELQKQIDADPELIGLDLSKLDRQIIDADRERSKKEIQYDELTDNGQKIRVSPGNGYAVIPFVGWAYPAGLIHAKRKLVLVDWFTHRGAIRTKDPARYKEVVNRLKRDIKYYRANRERLENEYRAAKPTVTSMEFWRDYLDMD